MAKVELWRGDDDGLKFGRKAMGWFKRSVAKWLDAKYAKVTKDQAAAMADWYAEDVLTFVEWTDDDNFRGSGYSNGHWEILWPDIENDAPYAYADVCREADAARFRSLDEWLAADAAGMLAFKGDAGGMVNVAPELLANVKRAAYERRMHVIIECGCGTFFKRDRANARNCADCRKLSQAERWKLHSEKRAAARSVEQENQ